MDLHLLDHIARPAPPAPRRNARRSCGRPDLAGPQGVPASLCPPALPFPASFQTSSLENKGFEPLTPGLQSRCSSQLS